MENVHGIAVAGGTFPAEIWRLFMEPALDGHGPRAVPGAVSWPVWKPFTRGRTRSRTTRTTPGDDGHDDRDGDDPCARDQTPAARQAGVESLSRQRG